MWRVWIGMVVLGVIIFVWGLNEARLSSGASSKAVDVSLADLEKGQPPANNHIRIGKHLAVYPATVYTCQVPKGAPQQPRPTSTVTYAYYPIMSFEHPFLVKLAELEKKYGKLDKVPEKEAPELEGFAVLVKTRMFGTVGSIPDNILPGETVQGLIINRVEKLDAEEVRLLKSKFPKMNFDKVLLLDSGRTPSSMLFALLAMLVGMVLAGSGGVIPWYLAKSKREEERRTFERQKARMAQAKANVRQAVAAGAIPGAKAAAPAQPQPAIIQPGQRSPISQRPAQRPGSVRPPTAPGAGARPPMVRPGQLRRPPPKA